MPDLTQEEKELLAKEPLDRMGRGEMIRRVRVLERIVAEFAPVPGEFFPAPAVAVGPTPVLRPWPNED